MTNIILPVQSAKIFGSFITLGSQIENADGMWKLLFDDSQTESCLWQFRLPDNYASDPILTLTYAMASATSGKIDLEADIMAVSDGDAQDINSASFDTINEIVGGTTVPGTAGNIDQIDIILTNNDSIQAEDLVIIRLHRDHDDADDTATGDVEILTATLKYTGA